MKKILSITLLSVLFFSCKNSTEKNNENSKHEISENEFKTSNPITVDFTNEINGFKVRAIWLIESLDSRYTGKLIGPAILTFTDVKTNKTYNVNHDGFSIDILPENEKFIKIEKNEGVEEYQSNASFTQKMEFKLPEIIVEQHNAEITSKDRNSGYKDYVPFFFKDIDFDNKPDLILTLAYFSEKGGFGNEVYKNDEFGFQKPYEDAYENFSNFYSNAASDSGAYSKTSIDYKTKRIYYNWMSGCCMSGEDIYEYDNENGGVNLVSKTEYDGLSGANEVIVKTTDKNGKVTITKKPFEK